MKFFPSYFSRFILSLVFVSSFFILTQCQNLEDNQELALVEMKDQFLNPPQEVKPWTYWYWINNHISKDGITKDLETMANLGIGAALIGNIYLPNQPEDGKVPMLSEEWKELTQYAIREGGRLGVDIGLFNSPGWSQSGGPWNDVSNSMRYLTSSEFKVEGGDSISMQLTTPSVDFEDVSLIAFPSKFSNDFDLEPFQVEANANIPNLENLLDNDVTTSVYFSDAKQLSLTFSTQKPQTIRSLKLTPSPTTFTMNVKVLAEIDGQWKDIRSFEFDRRNDMDQLGFEDYPPVVVAFPEVTAKRFKLELSQISPTLKIRKAGLASVSFLSEAYMDFYIEKQLAKMHQTPLPLDEAYKWPHQNEPVGDDLVVANSEIIDISEFLSDDGVLNWNAPEGNWTVLRMGMSPTGIINGPSAPNAAGLEVDKINKKALNQHFEAFVGDILSSMPPSERTALKYVVADSYETGSQNWTDGFQNTFKATYGYDPKTFFPVLTGRIVNSVEESNRFLWDLRRLVADQVAYKYVGGLRELCEENDLQLWLENYGHWGFPSEFLMYGGQSHLIGGEFWAEGDLGSIECRAASSAAHIYGKKQVSAESYTAGQEPYLRYPGRLKQRGDWSFTEGINHVVFHVYIQQPYDSLPGVNAWFGTEFNRHNTWFKESKPWIDYQRRSQLMLQQGQYVADIAYFIGEDSPKMTGVTKPELPKGYSFDYMNAEVIKERLTVKDGKITLPDGLSYKILVLPDSQTMRPELLEKIKKLVEQGANVMGNPPMSSPSLENYAEADEKVTSLSKELWGDDFVENNSIVNYKKGKLIPYQDIGSVLKDLKTQPDFKTEIEQPILWIHKTMKDTDIYFITNQSDEKITFDASFRVTGLQPELWDATKGTARVLPEFVENENYTTIPLELEASESGFVVFSKFSEHQPAEIKTNFPEAIVLKSIDSTWTVDFRNDVLEIDEQIQMKELADWTSFEREEIKYFSGTAKYKTNFVLEELPSSNPIFMDIGKADVMASIILNGKRVGGLWTAPWKIDVTEYLKAGENQLEIEVTNLWVNQLIKDNKRDKNDKQTWTLQPNPYKNESELQPSGLVGPVRLLTSDE